MNGWINFWTVAVIFGSASFAIVTVIVTWRGLGDLIDLIRALNSRK